MTAGANLGWNKWEGSYRVRRTARSIWPNPRSEAGMTWPVAEFDHTRSAARERAAITGVYVYRENAIKQLAEPADLRRQPERRDLLPQRRQAAGAADRIAIRRILFNDKGTQQDAAAADPREERGAGQAAPPRAPTCASAGARTDRSSC